MSLGSLVGPAVVGALYDATGSGPDPKPRRAPIYGLSKE